MVPIYAVESWLSLRYKDFSFTLALFRILTKRMSYCFCYLLIALLGTEEDVQEIIQNKSDHDLEHMMPFKWVMSTFERSQFLIKVKRGVLQYVVVKIICTILTLITSSIIISPPDENLFGENSYSPARFHVYVLILVNCSQIWAMYCLVLFYHACMKELAHTGLSANLFASKPLFFLVFGRR